MLFAGGKDGFQVLKPFRPVEVPMGPRFDADGPDAAAMDLLYLLAQDSRVLAMDP